MELKLKKINSLRIKTNIFCLILQTILTLGMWIGSITVTLNSRTAEPIIITWLFATYFLYGNIWLGFVLALDLKNKIDNSNEIKLLFSGIGAIISAFVLITWIIFVRELYFEKKYSIDLLDEVAKDEATSSKGE